MLEQLVHSPWTVRGRDQVHALGLCWWSLLWAAFQTKTGDLKERRGDQWKRRQHKKMSLTGTRHLGRAGLEFNLLNSLLKNYSLS